MAGIPTSYETGIADAMRRAGIGPNDPVMLVGHSQGGIVAARSAGDFVNNKQFNVTHVVTAGSPIGRIDIPPSVRTLSLENSGDVVPHLDASDNPDAPNRTTVTFDHQSGDPINNHRLDGNYVDAGHEMDTTKDASVVNYRNSASDYFGDPTVETRSYHITRQ